MSPAQRSPSTIYFFLSYAHAAPTSTHDDPADPSIAGFFDDLETAVRDLARPPAGARIGFYDQQIPAGDEIKSRLSSALGAAEVLVPLYSPGYFAKSWPQREQEVFRKRVRAAGATDSYRHVVPVLWTPLPSWEQKPDVLRALAEAPDNADYHENGLRAMRMLRHYRRSYESVLSWLAREVVDVAEQFPLGPSPAPDIDDVAAPPAPEAGFLVTMLAPEPDDAAAWWRVPPGRQVPLVVEHAASVAERLGLRTRVAEFVDPGKLFEHTPAIVIVDPLALPDRGLEYLEAAVAAFPAWVIPVLLDPGDPGHALAVDRVAALLGPRVAEVIRVTSMDELDDVLPTLVARARRTHLRQGQVFPPDDPSSRPPRLRNAPVDGETGPIDG